MAGTFEVIQWCLAILAGILTLVSAIVAVSDGAIAPVILFALAGAIVLPPLQPFLEEKLPFLRPKALKLFLCIFLAAIAPLTFRDGFSNLGEVRLCAAIESGSCTEDIRMFPRNTSTLYLSATPDNIADGTAIDLELNYTPEPDKSFGFKTQATQLKIQANRATIEIPVENLTVGTYNLNLSSEEDRFPATEIEFTVWDSSETIDALQSLEPSEATLENLRVCHQLQEPQSMEFETLQCSIDESVFPTQMKAAIANLDVQHDRDEIQETQVTFVWRYLPETGEAIEVRETKSIDNYIGTIAYLLASEDGFAPGDYELIVYLEAQNAKPIFRSFSVQA